MKIMALAIALITGIGMTGASMNQAPPGCVQDRVCLYENFGFRGHVWSFPPYTSHVGSANDQTSAVFNATSTAVLLYSDSDFRGSYTCLNRNTGIDNLALFFGQNDAISSVKPGPANGCG